VLALLAGGGYAYYRMVYLPGQETGEPVLTTGQVRRGDLVISVGGTGVLNPADEVDLGFQAEGYLDEVLVEVGDRVQAGDLLARQETGALERAVAEADIDARRAQLNLDGVSEAATDAELADAQATVANAQSSLLVAQYTYSTTLNSSLDSALRSRQIEYLWTVDQSWEADEKQEEGTITQDDYEDAWEDRGDAEVRFDEALKKAEMEDVESWNVVDQAQNTVYQAWENLKELQSGPATDTIKRAELSLDQAVLRQEEARADLEAAELRAPIDGTVVEVSAMAGENVGESSFITLADMEEPVVQFWVEESDMSGVAVGNRVEIIFEALPDETFSGEVVQVDPALVTVGGTLAVQAWASLDLDGRQVSLLGGMNAEVEVISAEARDVVLVPVQALREMGEGQYAVFVVQADGELEMRVVEVGLQDFANAEIISGLEEGETVSTGVEEESETTVPTQDEMMPMPGMRMFGG